MTPRQWLLAGVVVILGVAAFLLFRPDTLVTEVETTEALDDGGQRHLDVRVGGYSGANRSTALPSWSWSVA